MKVLLQHICSYATSDFGFNGPQNIVQGIFLNILNISEMKVTEEEMEAAGLDLDQRDYCAHHLIDFLKCSRENFPFGVVCKHLKHEWNNCQAEE